MRIRIDSDEYKCWHEVGHATVCLHLGGDVAFIEFLVNDPRGFARARCTAPADIDSERSVACAGFAAEFYLLDNRYAVKRRDDDRDINWIPFHNSTHDREDYWGRKLGPEEQFTKAEDEAFMHHALSLIPIFSMHFSRMQEVVRELLEARRVEGARVRELLRLDVSH